MPQTPPFSPFVPTGGLAENLVPNPPADMPEVPEVGDAMEALSPFSEPQDVKSIIENLSLNRPLPLYIPNRERYINDDFHIINDSSQELAEANRKGFQIVTHPDLVKNFEGKVSGIDKTGKITKPVLTARSKEISEIFAKRHRQALHDMYAAMDPRKVQFNSKYADSQTTINSGDTKGQFTGAGWRIKV